MYPPTHQKPFPPADPFRITVGNSPKFTQSAISADDPSDPFRITVGNSPKFTQFTPDDPTPQPLTPTLFFDPPLSRYTKGITPFEACIRPYRYDLNDGVFHTQLQRYVLKPCSRSDCPRHWLRYALNKYHQLTEALPLRAFWYHVRLTLPKRLTPADRRVTTAIRTWMTRMQAAIPDVSLTAVAHRGPQDDHYHVLTGSGQKVSPDLPSSIWEAARPHKRAIPWSESFARCKPHTNPLKVLHYSLTRETALEGQPTVCPWKGIKGHPVRTL
jgi:hypothetical protein